MKVWENILICGHVYQNGRTMGWGCMGVGMHQFNIKKKKKNHVQSGTSNS